MSKDYKMVFLMDIYGNALSDKQKVVLDYYYNQDFSLTEISQNVGITKQGVRDLIVRAEMTLNKLENQLNFLKIQRKNLEYINKINIFLEKINQYNKKFGFSKEVESCVNNISHELLKITL